VEDHHLADFGDFSVVFCVKRKILKVSISNDSIWFILVEKNEWVFDCCSWPNRSSFEA
jgi:hypothetical protein